MIQRFAVPVGAGAVSALLFALTVKGTPLALALAYLAPMPLMIAAFGWGALGGLAGGARSPRRRWSPSSICKARWPSSWSSPRPPGSCRRFAVSAALRAALAARRRRRPCPHPGRRGRHAGGGARGSRRSRRPGDADHRLRRLRGGSAGAHFRAHAGDRTGDSKASTCCPTASARATSPKRWRSSRRSPRRRSVS